jgi:hypothetical protein
MSLNLSEQEELELLELEKEKAVSQQIEDSSPIQSEQVPDMSPQATYSPSKAKDLINAATNVMSVGSSVLPGVGGFVASPLINLIGKSASEYAGGANPLSALESGAVQGGKDLAFQGATFGLGKILKPIAKIGTKSVLSGMAKAKGYNPELFKGLESAIQNKSIMPNFLKKMLKKQDAIPDIDQAGKEAYNAFTGAKKSIGGRITDLKDMAAKTELSPEEQIAIQSRLLQPYADIYEESFKKGVQPTDTSGIGWEGIKYLNKQLLAKTGKKELGDMSKYIVKEGEEGLSENEANILKNIIQSRQSGDELQGLTGSDLNKILKNIKESKTFKPVFGTTKEGVTPYAAQTKALGLRQDINKELINLLPEKEAKELTGLNKQYSTLRRLQGEEKINDADNLISRIKQSASIAKPHQQEQINELFSMIPGGKEAKNKMYESLLKDEAENLGGTNSILKMIGAIPRSFMHAGALMDLPQAAKEFSVVPSKTRDILLPLLLQSVKQYGITR